MQQLSKEVRFALGTSDVRCGRSRGFVDSAADYFARNCDTGICIYEADLKSVSTKIPGKHRWATMSEAKADAISGTATEEPVPDADPWKVGEALELLDKLDAIVAEYSARRYACGLL